jgi:hypothetical protein
MIEEKHYFFEETLSALNQLIIEGHTLVDTKKVRRKLGIQSSNRSLIQFIWKNLEIIASKGYLTLYNNKSPREWLLPKRCIR